MALLRDDVHVGIRDLSIQWPLRSLPVLVLLEPRRKVLI